jgi:hypothetical protein
MHIIFTLHFSAFRGQDAVFYWLQLSALRVTQKEKCTCFKSSLTGSPSETLFGIRKPSAAKPVVLIKRTFHGNAIASVQFRQTENFSVEMTKRATIEIIYA